jgi:hypothetical protein
MIISRKRLFDEVERTGFQPKYLEKALRLLSLINLISKHRDLKQNLALKGGTALNLYYFNMPRLSVDIDLNYIGEEAPGKMREKRENVEKSITDVCIREGFQISNKKADYANTTWKLTYQRVSGGRDTIKIDLNFLMRVPILPVIEKALPVFGIYNFGSFWLLDLHEVMAGKLRALFEREASRDLFDAAKILKRTDYDINLLKTLFVAYGAAKKLDWRTIAVDDIKCNLYDIKNNLMPLLKKEERGEINDIEKWGGELVKSCKENIKKILPLEENEINFLTCINEKGEIKPELLTKDKALGDKIRRNPALLWKVKNVRSHFNI